ncbi:MAG: glycogen/starch/alpha-glucan phosphorylase [Sandaracinus sp.]
MDRAALRASVVEHLAHGRIRDQYRATPTDVMHAVARAARDRLGDRWLECSKKQWDAGQKRVYYLSMEYLPGRLLRDALANLGILDEMRAAVLELGVDLDEVLEVEPDPGLGNGGLGRLASCFLDSMATLGIAGTGYGIRYDYGIFRQAIVNGQQIEEPDSWLIHGSPWEVIRSETTYRVRYGGHVVAKREMNGQTTFSWEGTQDVLAEAHDIPVPGYRNDVVNTLRLWWPRPVTAFDLGLFNAGDHAGSVAARNTAEHISRVLYPNDSGPAGKELRLRQEYFFVSASLQDAVTRHLARWGTLDDLPEHNVFQLNDTHPALAVAEMMRILLDEHRFTWERAWAITHRSFAYTNHTLLPEALETWPVHMLDRLLPRQLDIIREIDRRLVKQVSRHYPDDDEREAKMAIIEHGPQPHVRMANLSIVGSFSVNGVSALHSRLLREHMFPELDAFFPNRFRNKTNGVTPRRWIEQCNPELAALITATIGEGWVTQLDRLKALEKHATDAAFQAKFAAVKLRNKERLSAFLLREHGFEAPPHALFDIQIKRIHEYKRQQLNLLHVVRLYLDLKAGRKPASPRVVIIGGKAASAYDMAKRIIHLANAIGAVVNADPDTRDHLRLFFVPNYRVSYAEKLIPAADLSEQISTAGQEASGTGNMKLAMNGALTIGTLDGANVEIRDAVGGDNIFIFGLTTEEVLAKQKAGYRPAEIVEATPRLKEVLDAIAGGAFSPDEPGRFRPVVDSLRDIDRFFVLADHASYWETQDEVDRVYAQRAEWTRRAILNVANMGRFSSDATIRDYARDIWGLPIA